MPDWKQIALGGIGAGLGTWFGAWAAFGHEKRDRASREHREQGEALRRAMFVLVAQKTLLLNIRLQHLAKFAGHPLRHIALQPFFVAGEELHLELDRLMFVLNTDDIDLLNRLHVGNRRFRTVLSTIELRNSVHLEGQAIVAERATGDGATETEFRRLVGPHRWEQLRDFTDALYEEVDRAIDEAGANFASLRAVSCSAYPEVRLFTAKDLPAGSSVRKSNGVEMAEQELSSSRVGPASLTSEQRFQALLARFQDHTELLRSLTTLDLQVMGGFMALHLGLAAWLIDHTPSIPQVRYGLLGVVVVLTSLTIKLLYNSYKRRGEVVASLTNTRCALGFEEVGAYLPGKSLDAPTKFRAWFPWYTLGCVVTCAAVGVMILWGGFNRAV